MHTVFTNAPGIYNSVVDLTEMYSRGIYNLGREGQMKTIPYCI